MGEYNPEYDFGFTSNPTSVEPVTNFKADYYLGDIRLSWDVDPLSVKVVYVELENNGAWTRLATVRIDGKTHVEWIHEGTQPGVEYTYRLSVPDRSPVGPITRIAPTPIYLPMIIH
jgi:hypothetical protein